MAKRSLKPMSLAVGTAFVTSLAASSLMAETTVNGNPFALNELSGGYMQMADASKVGSEHRSDKADAQAGKKSEKEGKCGEGKCGGKNEMKKNMDGSCGSKKSEKEGKCGEGKYGSKK
ncbi:MAG: hypothetical protein AABY47_07055 [Pseudomonadota bacterium]